MSASTRKFDLNALNIEVEEVKPLTPGRHNVTYVGHSDPTEVKDGKNAGKPRLSLCLKTEDGDTIWHSMTLESLEPVDGRLIAVSESAQSVVDQWARMTAGFKPGTRLSVRVKFDDYGPQADWPQTAMAAKTEADTLD